MLLQKVELVTKSRYWKTKIVLSSVLNMQKLKTSFIYSVFNIQHMT